MVWDLARQAILDACEVLTPVKTIFAGVFNLNTGVRTIFASVFAVNARVKTPRAPVMNARAGVFNFSTSARRVFTPAFGADADADDNNTGARVGLNGIVTAQIHVRICVTRAAT
jgi:hypothetical protein